MVAHNSIRHRLVLLHGITATSHSLKQSAEILRDLLQADEVVLPDLPFHGAGEQLPSYKVPHMLEWLSALVADSLTDCEHLTIIAHSYSAALLLLWAQAQSKSLENVECIAIAPPLRITRVARQLSQAISMLPKRLSWHTFAGPSIKPFLQTHISAYPRRKLDRDRIYASTKHDDNSYERYVVQVQMNTNLYEHLERHPITEIHAPTLLLLCGKDLVVDSPRLARELIDQGHELLHIRYVSNSGHLLISQDPERLVRIIHEWQQLKHSEQADYLKAASSV
jgi:pimeloyl-ACP methyl ester carboxylesterase